MKLLEGITFPVDGRRVFQESFNYEQDSIGKEVVSRDLDLQSYGLVYGGTIALGSNPGTIKLSEDTLAYDPKGRRILALQTDNIAVPSGSSTVVLRLKFDSQPGTDPDLSETSVQHRKQDFEIAFVGQIGEDDIPLRAIEGGGSIGLLDDLRPFRNMKIPGSLVVEKGLTVIGDKTKIETKDQVIKDNLITLNDGEIGDGVTKGTAGLEVDRGPNQEEYEVIFDEASGNLKAGFVSDLQPVIRQSEGDNRYAPKVHDHSSLLDINDVRIRLKRDGNLIYWSPDGSNWLPFA